MCILDALVCMSVCFGACVSLRSYVRMCEYMCVCDGVHEMCFDKGNNTLLELMCVCEGGGG